MGENWGYRVTRFVSTPYPYPSPLALASERRWYNQGFLEGSFTVKEGIHPKYHDVEARCACGATWKTRSTKNELHLEICSNCHPFFTGRQKLLDTEGRVERFTKKFGAQTVASRRKPADAKPRTKVAAKPVLAKASTAKAPKPDAKPEAKSSKETATA